MLKQLLKVLVVAAIQPLGGTLLPGGTGSTPPDEEKP